jgi:hypothetical protein
MEKMNTIGQKHKVHTKGRYLLLLLFLGLMLLCGREVRADDGKLTIQLNNLGTPMQNVGFEIYKVGSKDEHSQWKLNEDLDGLGTDLNDLTYAAQWDAAASHLAYLVSGKNMEVKHAVTNTDGTAQISNLADGMYLVVQQNGETYGDISPFLISIPYKENDEWTSSVTVYPKASYTPKEEKGRITVTKRVGYMNMESAEIEPIIPQQEQNYYVGIFQDAYGTVPYGSDYIRKITLKGSSKGTAVFENLPPKTYYIFETDELGNVIPLDEIQDTNGYEWVCELDESYTQEVELTKGDATTGFINVYYDFPDDGSFFYGGELTIYKEVYQDGEQTNVDDTFYAGVFLDEEGEDLVTMFVLEQNSFVKVEVPLGGDDGKEPITYYIYETDQYGARVEESSFGYKIEGESSVNLRAGDVYEEVTLINTAKEIDLPEITATPQAAEPTTYYSSPSETPTSTPTSSPSENSGNSSSSNSVRTADDTPIALYLYMAAAAVLAGAGCMYIRKRRRK